MRGAGRNTLVTLSCENAVPDVLKALKNSKKTSVFEKKSLRCLRVFLGLAIAYT
jgi:hypothetical protein